MKKRTIKKEKKTKLDYIEEDKKIEIAKPLNHNDESEKNSNETLSTGGC